MCKGKVLEGCVSLFEERDMEQIAKAIKNLKCKMGYIFRWCFGHCSYWANAGMRGSIMET